MPNNKWALIVPVDEDKLSVGLIYITPGRSGTALYIGLENGSLYAGFFLVLYAKSRREKN